MKDYVSEDTSKKSRNWFYTLNNPEDKDIKEHKEMKCSYHVFQKEVGKKGTPHLQGTIVFKNAKTFGGMKKLMPKAHLRPVKNLCRAIAYCRKEKTRVDGPWEIGEEPSQGARTDLNLLKVDIVEKKRKLEDIILEEPIMYHQYGRTLEKIQDIAMNRNIRTQMTQGIWIYGRTATGKSEQAHEGYNPETHYKVPLEDNGWWDGYKQQEIVIMDDFRGQIPYDQLLRILDKYPYSVKRRHREPISFTSKTVIITCSQHPADIYHNRAEKDSIEQLLRRLVVRET